MSLKCMVLDVILRHIITKYFTNFIIKLNFVFVNKNVKFVNGSDLISQNIKFNNKVY